jgi:hypothetical protein
MLPLLTHDVTAETFDSPLEMEMSTKMSTEAIQSTGPDIYSRGNGNQFAQREDSPRE